MNLIYIIGITTFAVLCYFFLKKMSGEEERIRVFFRLYVFLKRNSRMRQKGKH